MYVYAGTHAARAVAHLFALPLAWVLPGPRLRAVALPRQPQGCLRTAGLPALQGAGLPGVRGCGFAVGNCFEKCGHGLCVLVLLGLCAGQRIMRTVYCITVVMFGCVGYALGLLFMAFCSANILLPPNYGFPNHLITHGAMV